jgi:hypothetical protein
LRNLGGHDRLTAAALLVSAAASATAAGRPQTLLVHPAATSGAHRNRKDVRVSELSSSEGEENVPLLFNDQQIRFRRRRNGAYFHFEPVYTSFDGL